MVYLKEGMNSNLIALYDFFATFCDNMAAFWFVSIFFQEIQVPLTTRIIFFIMASYMSVIVKRILHTYDKR